MNIFSKQKIIITTLFLLVLLVGCTQQNTPAETIKIGAVLPFTGSSGITGESSRNGIDLAVSEINSQGGIQNRKLEVLYEDSQTKTDAGFTAFTKLRSVDNISFVITSVSGVALAISPVANKEKIIQMDIVSATHSYSTPNDYTFRTGVNAYYFSNAMTTLLEKDSVKNVSILFVNTEYGSGYKDSFVTEYQKTGKPILLLEAYNQDEKDFATHLEKIRRSDPDALVLISLQKETPLILKEIDSLEIKIRIYTDVYAAEQEGNLETETSNRIKYVKPGIREDSEIFRKFAEKYSERYRKQPDFIAAQGYDGAMMLVTAMKQCNNPENTTCVKEQLQNIKNYSGAIGTNLSFDINGDLERRSFDVNTISNGSFVKIGEI